jgi:hypothetical protein
MVVFQRQQVPPGPPGPPGPPANGVKPKDGDGGEVLGKKHQKYVVNPVNYQFYPTNMVILWLLNIWLI